MRDAWREGYEIWAAIQADEGCEGASRRTVAMRLDLEFHAYVKLMRQARP